MSGSFEQIYFTRNGSLSCEAVADRALVDLFADKTATGDILLRLARDGALRYKSPVLLFFSEFAEGFLQAVSAVADIPEQDPQPIPSFFDELVHRCPLFRGSEYIDQARLQTLWSELLATFRRDCGTKSIRDFLAEEYPLWAEAGRVYLHIAENKILPDRPFTLLLTVAERDPAKPRLQHRPFGLAVADASKEGRQATVQTLLRILARAERHSQTFSSIKQTYGVYKPVHVTPREVFLLLNELPQIEHAGVLCKVPEFWDKKKLPTPQVQVTFKTGPKQNSLGVNTMLSFRVSVALGDETLSEQDIAELLASDEPVMYLRGRWIAVNRNQLKRIFGQWQGATEMAQENGVSFGEAMRWMSGLTAPSQGGENGEFERDQANGVDVQFAAEGMLGEVLGGLRAKSSSDTPAYADLLKTKLQATLRPYQQTGVDWLYAVTRLGMGGCLADDMGLGKSIQILSLLTIEQELFPNGANLLVLPASLIGNWLAEVKKFAPYLRVLVVHPSAGIPVSDAAPSDIDSYDLVISTYGLVTRPSWMQVYSWNLIVIDEAQAIKNPTTKQSAAIRALDGNVRIALTGTPVENNLTDLWSIFDFAVPSLLGSRERYATSVKAMAAKADFSSLRDLIQPWILRRKKSDKTVITDLPDKTELKSYCFLTPRQAKLYQETVTKANIAIAESEGVARKSLIFSTMMKLKQICNHPSMREGDGAYDPKLSGKFNQLALLCQQIAERQEKVLVFTQFREITDILAHYLEQVFQGPGLVLHGNVPVAKRQDLVDAFQAKDGPSFFILSIKAGGTGLNLTAASHVIHFDRWWNPAVENQATDRAYRIGQKNNVLVHKFICKGTIEEGVDALIDSKTALAGEVINDKNEFNLAALSDNELFELMRLKNTDDESYEQDFA